MKTFWASVAVAAALAGNSLAAVITDAGLRQHPNIVPAVENVASDKGFYGPPFPADYPHDSQPSLAPDMKRAKGSAVYPKVQESGFLDHDYVKDENGDGGEWKAQMEYDEARIKTSGEERLSNKAEERAAREREAYRKAEKEAREAEKQAEKAKEDADKSDKEAKDAEGKAAATDKAAADNKKAIEEAKKKVSEEEEMKSEVEKLQDKVEKAEEKYEEQKKAFEECQKQFEAAKTELEEVKKKLAAVEGSANATNTNLLISANDIEHLKAQALAAKAKSDAAKAALTAAEARKTQADKALSKQRAETDRAEDALKRQSGYLDKAKADMETARLNLRRIRGVDPDPTVRSSATPGTASGLLVALVVSLRLLA